MPTPQAIGDLQCREKHGAGIAQAAEQRFCKPQVWGFEYLYRLQHELMTWGLKPNGAARDCGSRFRGFDSLLSLQLFKWAVEVLGVLASLAKRMTDRFNADTVHQCFWLRSSEGRASR